MVAPDYHSNDSPWRLPAHKAFTIRMSSKTEKHAETIVNLKLRCMACDAWLTGETEEELLDVVQAHVRTHGHAQALTVEHIRSRLARTNDSTSGHDSTD